MFNGIMDGNTTGEDLRAAVRNPGVGGISINEYTRLKKVLSTEDVADDFTVVAAISDIIRTDPAQAKVLITNNVGVNLSRTTAKSLYTTASNNLTSESFLSTGEADRYREYLEVMISPGASFGVFNNNAESRKWAQVSLAYDLRVSDGENPALVAQELANVSYGADVRPLDTNFDQRREKIQKDYDELEEPTAEQDKQYKDDINRIEKQRKQYDAWKSLQEDLSQRMSQKKPAADTEG